MLPALDERPTQSNKLSRGDLASIVERGCAMDERLSAAFAPVEGTAADQLRQERLEEWKKVVAGGNEERFARRLAWDELSEDSVRRMTGPVRLRDRDALPAWAELLAALSADLSPERLDLPLRGCCREEEPIQFEHLLSVLVGAASERLRARCLTAIGRFNPTAMDGLERALLRRLAVFLSETLYLEFGIFRSRQASGLDLLLMRSRGDFSDDIYCAFLRHLFSGGLRELWLEYPALARLVGVAIESWIDASADLVERVQADAPEIAAWLSPEEPLQVVAVDGLLSDSHHRGRWVSILTFSSGARLVYKPRSVSNEAHWFRLLAWLNHSGSPQSFRCPRIMERPGYGWMELVSAEPLADAKAAERYFQRCGSLLAVAFSVGVNDLHFENLIAAGEYPVIIDLETILCHSPIETIHGTATDDILRTVFFESPVRTGLLPRWQLNQGAPFDVSGLGAGAGQRSRVPVPSWKDLNRDLMDLAYETVEGKPGTNAAMLDGEVLSATDYLDEIFRGFTEMYNLLLSRRDTMLQPGGPLAELARLQVRFIFRATAFYLLTAKSSRAPHLLREGADRSIYLESVAAPLLHAKKKPSAWPLMRLERRALEIEDCPHFSAAVSSAAIDDPEGAPLEGILEAPCYLQMIARFQRLSPEDLENHLGLIRASFDSRAAAAAHGARRANDLKESRLEPAPPLSSDQLLEEAARLADELLGKSISSVGRAPHWVTLRHLEAVGKNQLDPVGPDLFEGRAGISLMLAALFRVSGVTKYGGAARQIAQALGDELVSLDPQYLPPDMLVHGLTGVASLAYVYSHLSHLLEDSIWDETALAAVRFLTPETIAVDRRYDVLSGTAGSLIAALRVESAEGRQRAIDCGEYLLAARSAKGAGPRCWATFEERPISGFSHGNSGIAYALLRLTETSGDSRFRRAALEALSFEDETFSETEENWPDLRWQESSFAGGWCHGAPGMGLPRMAALLSWPGYPGARYLSAAVSAAIRHLGEGADHLCCGNFGRVLLLQALGRGLGRPDLIAEAEGLAGALVQRARAAGGYRLMRQYAGYISLPGLFQGTSGIAYALLKIGFPREVPDLIELK